MIWKNPGHFADQVIEKLVDFLVRRVHCRIEYSPLPLDFVGSLSASQLWMTNEPRSAMSRHVEFRHHTNSAIPGVSDQIADLILRVVEGVGTQFVKFRKFPALGTKALVLREVPVKNVHLHGFHAVDIPADDVERDEMACGIDHQTAPGETRLVLNLEHGCCKSAGGDIHQLKKGLEPVHRAERCRRDELRASGSDFQYVALVLADVLNFLARVIGLNDECCFCRLGRLEGERETCLTRELLQESLASTLQPRLGMAGECRRKRRVHSEAPCPRLRAGGKRHQIQCRLLSCSHRRVQQDTNNKYAKPLQPRILSHCPKNPPTQCSKSLTTAM